jgi:hypothetical protein
MNRFELDLSILVTQNCIKAADGLIERLGKIPATNPDLWAAGLFKLIMQVFGRCFLHKLLSGRCLREHFKAINKGRGGGNSSPTLAKFPVLYAASHNSNNFYWNTSKF